MQPTDGWPRLESRSVSNLAILIKTYCDEVLMIITFVLGTGIKMYHSCRVEWELKRQMSNAIDLEKLEHIVTWMPQTGQNLYYCAGIYRKAKEMKKAECCLYKAQQVSSNYNIYKALGNLAAEKKEYLQAIGYYNTALNIAPLLILPRYELFKIHQKTGIKEQACQQARIITSIQPKNKNEKVERIKEKVRMYCRP
jgi:tetratricopeptide (TPR) repeat protein